MPDLKPLSFFLERIGKRIYRDHHECCHQCDLNYKNGLVINDEQHADYLYEVQNEFALEGIDLCYRDAKD